MCTIPTGLLERGGAPSIGVAFAQRPFGRLNGVAALGLRQALPRGAMHLRVGRIEKEAEWVVNPPHNLWLRRRRPLPPDQNEEGKGQAYSRTDPHRYPLQVSA